MATAVRRAVGSAHAKTILLGEHAVVYGNPAIALPVPALTLEATATHVPGRLRLETPFRSGELGESDDPSTPRDAHLAEVALRNTLAALALPARDVTVSVAGRIPAARGLGSSAAVAGAIAVAVARLFGTELPDDARYDIVQSVERVAHGTPSGLDARTSASDSPIWFERGEADALGVGDGVSFLVADTGVRGHTVQAVAGVRELREREPDRVDGLFSDIRELTYAARDDLRDGRVAALGTCMDACQAALVELGVSSPEIDGLVDAARTAGAAGAKLTGGGQGGCIIALAPSPDALAGLGDALVAAGAAGVWPVAGGKENA